MSIDILFSVINEIDEYYINYYFVIQYILEFICIVVIFMYKLYIYIYIIQNYMLS